MLHKIDHVGIAVTGCNFEVIASESLSVLSFAHSRFIGPGFIFPSFVSYDVLGVGDTCTVPQIYLFIYIHMYTF